MVVSVLDSSWFAPRLLFRSWTGGWLVGLFLEVEEPKKTALLCWLLPVYRERKVRKGRAAAFFLPPNSSLSHDFSPCLICHRRPVAQGRGEPPLVREAGLAVTILPPRHAHAHALLLLPFSRCWAGQGLRNGDPHQPVSFLTKFVSWLVAIPWRHGPVQEFFILCGIPSG